MPLSGKKHWLRRYDWDAIAGVVAAAAALILHLLHIVQSDILLTLTLVLVALLLLRQLRHEEREERVEDIAGRTEQLIVKLHDVLKAAPVITRTAVPGRTSPSNAWPASASPTTANSSGVYSVAPVVSAPLSA